MRLEPQRPQPQRQHHARLALDAARPRLPLELAEDEEFRNRQILAETVPLRTSSTSTGYAERRGEPEHGHGLPLAHGVNFIERSRWWMATASFVVSDLTSDWLGGDRYSLRLSHGNGTSDGLPSCMDTYVDSSSPSDNYDADEEMLIALDTSARQTILFGDPTSHLLPAGYAVQRNVSMELSPAAGGSPVIGPSRAVSTT